MLASLLYPYDDDAGKRIDGWLTELERENCVVRYEVEGNTYLEVCNWLNHQRIDRPSASKIPPFDESSRVIANPREASCEERKGKEGKGRERKLAEDVVLETVEGLNLEAWAAWVAYRKGIDKPIRPASIAAAAKKLAAYGPKQMAAVEHSIANGWQGLFDPPAVVATNGAKPPCPPMYLAGNEYNPAHREWMERYA
jgi:hypothetical protein